MSRMGRGNFSAAMGRRKSAAASSDMLRLMEILGIPHPKSSTPLPQSVAAECGVSAVIQRKRIRVVDPSELILSTSQSVDLPAQTVIQRKRIRVMDPSELTPSTSQSTDLQFQSNLAEMFSPSASSGVHAVQPPPVIVEECVKEISADQPFQEMINKDMDEGVIQHVPVLMNNSGTLSVQSSPVLVNSLQELLAPLMEIKEEIVELTISMVLKDGERLVINALV